MKIKTLAIVGAHLLLLNKTYGQFVTSGTIPVTTSNLSTDGKIGIGVGTAIPNAHLYVKSSTNNNTQIAKFADEARYIGIGRDEVAAYDLNGNRAHTYIGGDGTITTKLTVLTNGNVGIGTTTPGAKLEVAGQVKITGGTPGSGKVLTSDAAGLASWTNLTGLLSGGSNNYIPKWSSGNALQNSQIYDNGSNVGIGTTSPYMKFTVHGDASFGNPSGAVNGNSGFEIIRSNTLPPTRRGISIDDDNSGKFNFYIHQWQTNAGFYFKEGLNNRTLVSINADGRTDINASTETSKYFVVNNNDPTNQWQTNYESFVVYGNGKTRIGKEKPVAPHDDALLGVHGKIVCKSLYVLKASSWADFVFKRKDLEKLENVERYINENKHLPGVPSEEEVLANGYDINEMDAKLLEKIETLYLHIIALEKEIKELKNK